MRLELEEAKNREQTGTQIVAQVQQIAKQQLEEKNREVEEAQRLLDVFKKEAATNAEDWDAEKKDLLEKMDESEKEMEELQDKLAEFLMKKKKEENQRGNFIFQNKNQFIGNSLELRSNSQSPD